MIRTPAALHGLIELMTALVRGREAVAAVEFALILPVMLTMYLGSIELSQAISVDQRVTVVAGTVGDLVARANGEITAANLTDYFQAAQSIIAPFSTTGLTQVVSLVQISSTGVTTVLWSQAYNGGTAKTANQPYPGPHAIPTTTINMWNSNYVIVSESTYSYLPLLGIFFKTPFSLYHQNFYLPRYPGKICYNTTTC
jgi:Flp pilus assembly protein TadG